MHVLANGDIVDCGRLPNTARNSLYKTELCKHYTENGACRYGSKCQFAHGEEELRGVLRHPKYKTTRCKAYLATGRCMYGNRCRFIHSLQPEDGMSVASSSSSTSSEVDESEVSHSSDWRVNPFGDGTAPIDLSAPFGGLKQVTLTRLTSLGSGPTSPPGVDGLVYEPMFPVDSEPSSSTSSVLDHLELVSPRGKIDAEDLSTSFSRLSVFQRICREGV
ncbi:hypothetical protein PINS_up000017 [Pythium insidiosum]|nr:hypothetical protein PINS_up000017 [Pythium insidiosum]